MSKEYLEALKILKTPLHNEWLRFYPQFKELDEKTKIVDGVRMVSSDADAFLTIEQALQRLESIDNANPSEALEDLDKMANQVFQVDDKFELYYNKVKQHILKAQEQEKVLSIIKETKNIKVSFYENGSGKHYKLEFDRTRNQTITEQEYDLLKRWLG